MFKKEAEEYMQDKFRTTSITGYNSMKQAFQKGAEYGYNKAKGEVITEATKNYNAIIADYEKHYKERIAELEKANEKHSPDEHIDKDRVVLGIIKHCNKTRYSLVQWNGEWWYQYGTYNAEVRLIAWYNIPELPKESE